MPVLRGVVLFAAGTFLWKLALAQPGGGGSGITGTESSATGCSVATGTQCASDGSTHEAITSGLTYSSTSGKFVGTLKGNQCPPSGNSVELKSTCMSFDFPKGGEADWASPPYAAGLRGTVGFTFSLNYIYGPMDAGFGSSSNTGVLCNLLTMAAPEVCSVEGISCCPPGTTAAGCEDKIRYECETGGGSLKSGMFLDKCGLHTPDKYHAHVPPRCEYQQANPTGHSEIVALAIDGYGMYGIWETATTMPDLDVCNGHTSMVPANTQLGTSSSSVYHYHFTPYVPFTMGCFGPASSVEECKGLYSECSGETVSYNARFANGTDYVFTGILDCPCFYQMDVPSSYKTVSVLDPHYNDNIDSVDSSGYNVVGNTMAANGYYTDGSGSGPSPTPSGDATTTIPTTTHDSQSTESTTPEIADGQLTDSTTPEIADGQRTDSTTPEIADGQWTESTTPEIVDGQWSSPSTTVAAQQNTDSTTIAPSTTVEGQQTTVLSTTPIIMDGQRTASTTSESSGNDVAVLSKSFEQGSSLIVWFSAAICVSNRFQQ